MGCCVLRSYYTIPTEAVAGPTVFLIERPSSAATRVHCPEQLSDDCAPHAGRLSAESDQLCGTGGGWGEGYPWRIQRQRHRVTPALRAAKRVGRVKPTAALD